MMRSRTVLGRSRIGLGMLVLAAMLGSSAARAQIPNINLMPELKSKTPEEREQEAIADKAYRDSLRKIPDAKASSDPWGDARAVEAKPAPKAKAAAPKPRTSQIKSKPAGALD